MTSLKTNHFYETGTNKMSIDLLPNDEKLENDPQQILLPIQTNKKPQEMTAGALENYSLPK